MDCLYSRRHMTHFGDETLRNINDFDTERVIFANGWVDSRNSTGTVDSISKAMGRPALAGEGKE